ncbi:flavin reductase family protein [Rubinisphaera margarita]|uniref:flavin reductase family protein n=1 Tax=Rubinisphaera margarita TaxID=2909586 RepID=UPI001EE82D28|nr:flavin reductase family protein [Rubinisphaera margarita]MCG6155381.1 flavin reductase family protein [Rubinisphaera margarita]
MDTNDSAAADPFLLLDPELWVITSQSGTTRNAMIATFVMPVSIVPDRRRFVTAIATHHFSHELLRESRCCALHLITRDQVDWVARFGIPTGRKTDKLAEMTTTTLQSGAPILTGALAAFDCRVVRSWSLGDRELYLLDLLESRQFREGTPLRFDEMWNLLESGERSQLSESLQRDQQIDREAIDRWAAEAGDS